MRIACQGAETWSPEELLYFQGRLKTLRAEDPAKLRREIAELGFSEPIAVWQRGSNCYVPNGHQRLAVQRRFASARMAPRPGAAGSPAQG